MIEGFLYITFKEYDFSGVEPYEVRHYGAWVMRIRQMPFLLLLMKLRLERYFDKAEYFFQQAVDEVCFSVYSWFF